MDWLGRGLLGRGGTLRCNQKSFWGWKQRRLFWASSVLVILYKISSKIALAGQGDEESQSQSSVEATAVCIGSSTKKLNAQPSAMFPVSPSNLCGHGVWRVTQGAYRGVHFYISTFWADRRVKSLWIVSSGIGNIWVLQQDLEHHNSRMTHRNYLGVS